MVFSSDTELAAAARQVIEANDRDGPGGRYTIPSPTLYPHQWAWDSAFAALGWARIEMGRALTELETLLASRWADGRVPHIKFHHPSPDYFPGHERWGTGERLSSSISQPPVWATVARRLYDQGADRGRLTALIGPMDESHRWFGTHRDPQGLGLVAMAHPWESGMDNSPAWDAPLTAVDPESAPPFQRVDKKRVGDASTRPTDEEYKRYMALVAAIQADDFGQGPFEVYDPGFSALLCQAELDLAWLGERLGVETHAQARADRMLKALVTHLWRPELNRFAFLDTSAAGEAVTPREVIPNVAAASLPGILPLPDPIVAACRKTLETDFATEWPVPSTAPTDAAFDARRYWRGPTWINVNWLFIPLMGEELARRSLDLIRRNGFREYFDPQTGEGLGAERFTWTAALALDWL